MNIYLKHIINNFNIFGKKSRFFFPLSPKYSDLIKGRSALIFGNGPSINQHKKNIIDFIKKENLITFGGNNISEFYPVDFLAFTNRKRFSKFSNNINKSSKLLLSPYFKKKFIENHIGKNKKYYEIMYLNNRIEKNRELINSSNLILYNCRTVSLILILVAYVMGAEKIYIAGLDGYKFENDKIKGDTNFYGIDYDYQKDKGENFFLDFYKSLVDETSEVLDIQNNFFEKKNKNNYFKIITPTCYSKYYDEKIL